MPDFYKSMIRPEDLRMRRRDANLVAELFDATLVMDSKLRRERYDQAKEWFCNKHHCEWQGWAENKEKIR